MTDGRPDEKTIADAVQARVEAEQGAYPAPDEKGTAGISSRYVQACLDANELGDGLLYAAVNRDKFIYNVTAQEWLKWDGHHWAADEHNQAAAAAENVVDRLLEETADLSRQIDEAVKRKDKELRTKLEKQRDRIYRRIDKLRTERGRNPCLKFAISCRDPLTVTAESLDRLGWVLPVQNGLIDLVTGKFREGRREDFVTIVSPISWQGYDVPRDLWVKYLLEVMNGEQEMVDYLQRLLGYAITGSTREHIMPVFWGKGRNGKGTLVKIMQHVMGPLAGTIQTEMLLYSRMQRSSAGPSPDIMDLKGLRMAFASETEEGQRFSASKVKWLTGGDQLVGRNLNEKKQLRFNPSHTVFLMTNDKPVVAGDDYAFWKRVHLIPFKLSYVVDKAPEDLDEFERIADPDMEEKLKTQAPGILAWLVEGCFKYQKEGLNPPATVRDATLEYQQDEDLLGQFLEGYCEVKPGLKGKSSDIFDKFNRWFKENVSPKGISHKRFGGMMKKRFYPTKVSGIVYYQGVELDLLKIVDLPGED